MITFISLYEEITAYPIRILSAYVRDKGFKSRIIFMPDYEFGSRQDLSCKVSAYKERIINQLIELCSDSSLIGLSFFTCGYYNATYLTECLKNKLNIPIIWGGKHSSAKPEQCLSYADMVCIGEGEDALVELLQKMKNKEDYHNTQNIWFRHNGGIIKNPLRPLIQNLDSIPFQDYSFEEHYIWEKEIGKITQLTLGLFRKYAPREYMTDLTIYETPLSRGCHYNCTYCYSFRKIYQGQKYLRFRSIENIIQELELIKEKLDCIQMVCFIDDNLVGQPIEQIERFCRIYKEKIQLPITFSGHPYDINEEKLSCFIDAGLQRIHMGIQTGSKRTQRMYKRLVTDETVLNAVRSINKFKKSLFPSYDIIIDNPYEDNEDILHTLKLLMKIPRPRQIEPFSLTFYPGTELYEKAKQDGTLSDEEELKLYGKDYLSFCYRKKKYLNFIFPLLNRGVPNFLINILINKYMVWLFDSPLFNEFLFKIGTLLRRLRRRKNI